MYIPVKKNKSSSIATRGLLKSSDFAPIPRFLFFVSSLEKSYHTEIFKIICQVSLSVLLGMDYAYIESKQSMIQYQSYKKGDYHD